MSLVRAHRHRRNGVAPRGVTAVTVLTLVVGLLLAVPAGARSECLADGEGDLLDLTTGREVRNPRGDIHALCVDHSPGQVEVQVRLGAGSDIATDPVWTPGVSGLVVEVDVDPPAGEAAPDREYDLIIGRARGVAAWSVQRVADEVTTCGGDLTDVMGPADAVLSLAIPTTCVAAVDGSAPSVLRAGAYLVFEEAGANPTFDEVPVADDRFGASLGTEADPADAPFAGIIRLAGATRLETAVAISRQSFPSDGSAGAVVLATGRPPASGGGPATSSPDALAAAPLAADVNAPVLLIGAPAPSGQLPDVVMEEIRRVLPAGGTVYLVGGSAVIDPHVEDVLSDAGYSPRRLAGSSREATSLAVALAIDPQPSRVVLADGGRFEFALLGAAYAAHANVAFGNPDGYGGHGVLLLTSATAEGDGQLAPVTEQYLRSLPPGAEVVTVGQGATAAAIAGGLTVAPKDQVVAEGDDPFTISTLLAARYGADEVVPGPASPDGPEPARGIQSTNAPTTVVVASGVTFPDALGGAALAGRLRVPLLFSQPDSLPEVVRTHLRSLDGTVDLGFVLGGTATLREAVASQVSVCATHAGAGPECR